MDIQIDSAQYQITILESVQRIYGENKNERFRISTKLGRGGLLSSTFGPLWEGAQGLFTDIEEPFQ